MNEYYNRGASEKKLIKHIKEQGSSIYKREISVDHNLIDLFFSNSDSLYAENVKDLEFEKVKKIEEINYIINNMLPEIEKQVIYLLFFLRKKQETVGRLLNISQEMVFYYKKRALSRIKIHFFFRSVDINEMEVFLENNVTKKQKVAMLEYFKEHDLRKIAKKITLMEDRKQQIHYESIGSRIKLGFRKLKSLKNSENPEIQKNAIFYCEIFSKLKKYNSLHHTQSKKQISREIIA